MTARQFGWLKEAKDLIFYYQKPAFRGPINEAVIAGSPILLPNNPPRWINFYLPILINFSPTYWEFYKEFRATPPNKYIEGLERFLEQCAGSRSEFNRLDTLTTPAAGQFIQENNLQSDPQYIDPQRSEFNNFLQGMATGIIAGEAGGGIAPQPTLAQQEEQINHLGKAEPWNWEGTREESQKLFDEAGKSAREKEWANLGQSLKKIAQSGNYTITPTSEDFDPAKIDQYQTRLSPTGVSVSFIDPASGREVANMRMISENIDPAIKYVTRQEGPFIISRHPVSGKEVERAVMVSGTGGDEPGEENAPGKGSPSPGAPNLPNVDQVVNKRAQFVRAARDRASLTTRKYTQGISGAVTNFAESHPTITASAVGGGIGAIAGSVAGPRGMIAGAASGISAPAIIKGVGSKAALRSTVLKAGAAALGLSNPVGWALMVLTTKTGRKIAKIIIVAVLIVLLFPTYLFIDDFLQSSAPLSIVAHSPFFNPSQSASFGSGSFSATCQFYRSGIGETYQSSMLLQYFQEASGASNVPAVLLAAIARVETNAPAYTNQNVQAMIAYANQGNLNYDQMKIAYHPTINTTDMNVCPISPTNALGIMQVQPPGSPNNSFSADGVKLGAGFAGVDFNRLMTDQQYTISTLCNPLKNIEIAAGVIIAKMGATAWNQSWIDSETQIYSLARDYYGCPEYPGCYTGPNSYGADLWTSIESCRSASGNFVYYCQKDPQWQTSTLTCSPPNPPIADVANTGCGPTSLAMVFSTFGIQVNPLQMWDALVQNQWLSCDGTSMLTILTTSAGRDWLNSYNYGLNVGLPLVSGGQLNATLAKQYIRSGYLIIGSSKTYPFGNTTADHIFVVSDVDPTAQTFTVHDPYNCTCTPSSCTENTNTTHPLDWFSSTQTPGGQGWAYAYPLKKGSTASLAPGPGI